LTGGLGNDTISGGAGADTISGGAAIVSTSAGINNLSGGDGADLVILGGDILSTEANTIAGGTGLDTLQIGATASSVARAINLVGSSVTGFENLDLAANTGAVNAVTMTGAQYQQFTGTLIGLNGNDSVTLTSVPSAGITGGDGTIGTISVVEGTTITIAAAATAAAQIITETGTVGTVSIFILGTGAYTGVWTGIDTTDVVRVVNGTNVAGNTGLNTGVVYDFQNATATLTLNLTQNGLAGTTFLNAGTGVQTIALSAADTFTTNTAIEAYTALSTSVVTIATGHTAVNLAAAADTSITTVNVGAQVLTGTFALNDGADVIVLTTGSNIAGVNAGAAISATATASVDGLVTMTAAQNAAFVAIGVGGIVDGGVVAIDQITLTTAGTVLADADIEQYVLANGTNAFTFSTTAATVTGGTGADTINVVLANVSAIATGVTLPVDGVSDRISVVNTALQIDQTGLITVSGFLPGNAGDAIRVIDTAVAAGTSQSNVSYTAIAAASNTAYAGAAGGTLEIENSNVAAFTDTANGGVIETLLIAALGQTTVGTYTVIVYSGADAGIYEMLVGTNAMTAAGDITVELVAVLTGVGANAMTVANVY
jgi:hypothetical protein